MNENRRKLLKIAFVGSGALMIQRILGPLYQRFFGDRPARNYSPVKKVVNNIPSNFRVARNGQSMSIYDSRGEEIFQIDDGV